MWLGVADAAVGSRRHNFKITFESRLSFVVAFFLFYRISERRLSSKKQ
jgi:hypothetical protein